MSKINGPESKEHIDVVRYGNVNKCCLPEAFQLLNAEQMKRLELYKHKGTKTMLELFYVNYIYFYLEKLYPSALNANFVTLIGQLPMPIIAVIFLYKMGFNLSAGSSKNIDPLFFWAGLGLIWFTGNDLMDGIRARRLKGAGSPLGRVFDEANDMIQMTCYSLILGYLFRFDNAFFELVLFVLPVVVFCMEMKYILCNELILTFGEVGSIEIETIFSIMFIVAGLHGSSFYEATLG